MRQVHLQSAMVLSIAALLMLVAWPAAAQGHHRGEYRNHAVQSHTNVHIHSHQRSNPRVSFEFGIRVGDAHRSRHQPVYHRQRYGQRHYSHPHHTYSQPRVIHQPRVVPRHRPVHCTGRWVTKWVPPSYNRACRTYSPGYHTRVWMPCSHSACNSCSGHR